jgi:hypothetical protein
METGMGFVLKVGEANKFPNTPQDWPKCGSFNYKKTPVSNNSMNIVFNYYFLACLTLIIVKFNL